MKTSGQLAARKTTKRKHTGRGAVYDLKREIKRAKSKLKRLEWLLRQEEN